MLLNYIKFISTAIRVYSSGEAANLKGDYDSVSSTYDQFYSKNLSSCAMSLMEKLPIESGSVIADVACGTGFFTHKVAKKVGPSGKVMATDISDGMLHMNELNAKAAGLTNIDFKVSSYDTFLKSIANETFDGLVCGWGFCYFNQSLFLKEAYRTLKPNGFLGLIENKDDSLKEIFDIFQKVLLRNPTVLKKNVKVNLPKSSGKIAKQFKNAGFQVTNDWEGDMKLKITNPDDVISYIRNSGIASGFLDAIDPTKMDKLFAEFHKLVKEKIAKEGSFSVIHRYASVLAKK